MGLRSMMVLIVLQQVFAEELRLKPTSICPIDKELCRFFCREKIEGALSGTCIGKNCYCVFKSTEFLNLAVEMSADAQTPQTVIHTRISSEEVKPTFLGEPLVRASIAADQVKAEFPTRTLLQPPLDDIQIVNHKQPVQTVPSLNQPTPALQKQTIVQTIPSFDERPPAFQLHSAVRTTFSPAAEATPQLQKAPMIDTILSSLGFQTGLPSFSFPTDIHLNPTQPPTFIIVSSNPRESSGHSRNNSFFASTTFASQGNPSFYPTRVFNGFVRPTRNVSYVRSPEDILDSSFSLMIAQAQIDQTHFTPHRSTIQGMGHTDPPLIMPTRASEARATRYITPIRSSQNMSASAVSYPQLYPTRPSNSFYGQTRYRTYGGKDMHHALSASAAQTQLFSTRVPEALFPGLEYPKATTTLTHRQVLSTAVDNRN